MASAVVGLAGTAWAEHHEGEAEAKACYRPHCGSSVKGHEGSCGGTKVEELSEEAACETAGGAWATEEEAKKLKDLERENGELKRMVAEQALDIRMLKDLNSKKW